MKECAKANPVVTKRDKFAFKILTKTKIRPIWSRANIYQT